VPDSFDVVVVGARCAGSPLAMLLSRRGLRVCLLDRSRFPSDVPSTHAIQPNGVAALERFGLGERIRSTGAPPIVQARIDLDGAVMDYTGGRGIVGFGGAPMFCVRRSTLDQQLIEAAVEAGADFRPATAVRDLLWDGGRVVGVDTAAGPVHARLVVGADGPHSTVARRAGAREYHASPPGRMFMWGYFEGVRNPPPRLSIGKSGDTAFLAAPTDGDLFLLAAVPSLADKERHLSDPAAGLTEVMRCFPEVSATVGNAGLAGPVRTMTRWHGYFRQAAGPGWVLVGDAGHFKDPTPGQGIADAFRQVEHLAPVVSAGMADGGLDRGLASWAEWRDRDAWEMYWFAGDLGAPGPTPPLVREMIRQLVARPGGADRFMRVLDHQLPPSQVFTPLRALAAGAGLVASRGASPRLVGRELHRLIGRETSRRRMRRHPRYDAPAASGDRDPAPVGAAAGA
jgi:2-polyprenyl-6-methoxyphenol hydroxylase-like FAD-dependent oxidoreductase